MSDLKILKVIDRLCDENSQDYKMLFKNGPKICPSVSTVLEMIELCRVIFFPSFYGEKITNKTQLKFNIGQSVLKLQALMKKEIHDSLCFLCSKDGECEKCTTLADSYADNFLEELAGLRELLLKDVEATFHADPAAKTLGEIIFCYPGLRAITNYRIAHALLKIGVPLLPRIITEIAHSETGIDIHPGATISDSFFIDHGTGVVIGETTIIGKNVKIYQGVTLGAKSFQVDSDGNLIKDALRHPIIEDNVTIYAGATILGRIVIGKNSIIGGNVWLTDSVPENSKILRQV